MKTTRLEWKRCDITKLKIQCIVNAANETGLGCFTPNHPCIDNAIHKAAGPGLLEECKTLGGVPTGVAKLTRGHLLPCEYIIHVTGPRICKQYPREDHKLLAQCYQRCLDLCQAKKINQVAFCCISTGIFGYSKPRACQTAIEAVRGWLKAHPDTSVQRIVFVVWTDQDQALYSSKF